MGTPLSLSMVSQIGMLVRPLVLLCHNSETIIHPFEIVVKRHVRLWPSRDPVTQSAAKSPSPCIRDGFCTEFTPSLRSGQALERSEGFRMTMAAPAGGRADFGNSRLRPLLGNARLAGPPEDAGSGAGVRTPHAVHARPSRDGARSYRRGGGGRERTRDRRTIRGSPIPSSPIQNPKSKIQNPKSAGPKSSGSSAGVRAVAAEGEARAAGPVGRHGHRAGLGR